MNEMKPVPSMHSQTGSEVTLVYQDHGGNQVTAQELIAMPLYLMKILINFNELIVENCALN